MVKNLLWLALPAFVTASSRHQRAVTCACSNGTPNNDCNSDTDVSCIDCNDGYQLSTEGLTGVNKTCTILTCECENGIPLDYNDWNKCEVRDDVDPTKAKKTVCKADSCDEFYHISSDDCEDCNSSQIKKGNGICVENFDSTCSNGTPLLKSQSEENVEACSACQSGYHLENSTSTSISADNTSNQVCVEDYDGICDNGAAVIGKYSTNDTISCIEGACNAGFHHENIFTGSEEFNCIADYDGICDNGSPVTAAYETDDVVSCDTCNNKYHIIPIGVTGRNDCEEDFLCDCEHGEPMEDCTFAGEQKCDNVIANPCNATTSFASVGNSNQFWCQPYYTCLCEHGEPKTDCTDDSTISCLGGDTCNPGYHDAPTGVSSNIQCEANTCLCINGAAKTGGGCLTEGVTSCDTCNQGYKIEDIQFPGQIDFDCEAITCSCLRGTGFDDGNCKEEFVDADGIKVDNCESCDPGYTLKQGAKLRDGSEPNIANGTEATYANLSHCKPSECACNNGTPQNYGDYWKCTSLDYEICIACNDFYHLDDTDCTDCSSKNPDDGLCVENECFCGTADVSLGTPVNNTVCADHNTSQCSACDADWHHVNSEEQCVQNVCVCASGTPSSGTDCTKEGGHMCDTCDRFHHLETQAPDIDGHVEVLCVPNVCDCINGVTVSNSTCENHNGDECVLDSCDTYFYQATPTDNEPCLPTVCNCPLGSVNTTACLTNGATVCESCNDDWLHVDDNHQCVQNICVCDNGNEKTGTACTEHNSNMCADCNDYYHLKNDKCKANVCTCEDQSGNQVGTPHGEGQCIEHKANECADCNSIGYHVPAYTYDIGNDKASLECEAKVCVCPNGDSFAKANGNCTIHGDTQCTACDDYYHLSTYETDNDNCNANVCTCTGGTAAGIGECDTHETEQCLNCNDFGYTVDAGTGGCRANECICERYHDGETSQFTPGVGRGTAAADAINPNATKCSAEGASECAFCWDGIDDTSIGQYWHVDTYSDPSSESYNKCVINVCWCVDGTEKGFNACPEHYDVELGLGVNNNATSVINGDVGGRGHFCDVCDDQDMVLNDNKHCVNRPCLCTNGLGEDTGRCNKDLYHICKSCQSGYKIDGTNFTETIDGQITKVNRCVPNVCRCDHGEELNDGKCLDDGAIGCVFDKCDPGYHFNSATLDCDENICTCENGDPRTGTTKTVCSTDGAHECDKCDYFYNDDTDPFCTANVCVCSAGTPVNPGSCMKEGRTQCAECNDVAYRVQDHDPIGLNSTNKDHKSWPKIIDCVPKECLCENGNELASGNCTHHQENMCIEDACDLGYHSESNLRGGFDCVENVCICPLGTPRNGTDCTTHGSNLCETCTSPGMRTDNSTNWQCTQNICSCNNGIEDTDEDCTLHGANYCSDCIGNYHLAAHITDIGKQQCDENECICLQNDGGTPVPNANCTVNGGEQCLSCVNINYLPEALLDGSSDIPCQPKQCKCNNGVGVRDGTCDNVATEKCATCDADYALYASIDGGDDLCYPICYCENGPAKLSQPGECTGVNHHQCQDDCDYGYNFVNSTITNSTDLCKANECICDNGLGLNGGYCPNDGDQGCASCDQYFHLEVDKNINITHINQTVHICEENVCRCDEGDAVLNSSCNIHRETQCTACHDIGYKVDELERCSPKCCSCDNGIGVHDGTCVDENMNRCMQCHAGYKLEWTEQTFYKLKYVVDDPNINYTVFNDANDPVNFQDVYNTTETKVYWAETCVDLDCPDTHYFTMNECLPKECFCDFGTVVDSCTYVDNTTTIGSGLIPGDIWIPHQECQSCDRGFKLDANSHCVPHENKCVCDWGEPAYGHHCLLDGDHVCVSCTYPGFSVDAVTRKCEHTVCSCDNGKPIADGTCMSSLDQRCVECDDGYHLTIVYKDDNSGHYEEHCVASASLNSILSCDPLTEHVEIDENGDKFCANNICLCENGNPFNSTTASPCEKHLGFMCDTCYDGFQIKEYADPYDHVTVFDRTCELIHIEPIDNTNCWCDFGHQATFDECSVDAHHCVECYTSGYVLNSKTNICEPRVCDCENGHGVADGTCFLSGVQNCVECDEGYMMKIKYHDDGIHYNHVCTEILFPYLMLKPADKENNADVFKAVRHPDDNLEYCLGKPENGTEKDLQLMSCDSDAVLKVWFVEEDNKIYTKLEEKSKRCLKFGELISITSCQKVEPYTFVENDEGREVLADQNKEILIVSQPEILVIPTVSSPSSANSTVVVPTTFPSRTPVTVPPTIVTTPVTNPPNVTVVETPVTNPPTVTATPNTSPVITAGCICDNGTPQTGKKCPNNGDHICASCDAGFSKNKNTKKCDEIKIENQMLKPAEKEKNADIFKAIRSPSDGQEYCLGGDDTKNLSLVTCDSDSVLKKVWFAEEAGRIYTKVNGKETKRCIKFADVISVTSCKKIEIYSFKMNDEGEEVLHDENDEIVIV